MVKFLSLSAILALAAIPLTRAAPAPAPAVAALDGVFEGNVTRTYMSKEEAQALHTKQGKRSERSEPLMMVESRQDAFGSLWENWDFTGASWYIRPQIDGRSHYITDAWNDRISSIWNYSPDKKCTYWTEYAWDGDYCWGDGLILAGRSSYARLYAPFNDRISCSVCQWN
ncbi:hypothetical protein BGZ60DRAFT_531578 [Tricladium varicosporioides]|nr:hypothetical protein BGZ60DRAFT_531578 [Hymenoscyphus varicosporioides]